MRKSYMRRWHPNSSRLPVLVHNSVPVNFEVVGGPPGLAELARQHEEPPLEAPGLQLLCPLAAAEVRCCPSAGLSWGDVVGRSGPVRPGAPRKA